jgi:chromosomal replication initiator protein
LSSKLSQGAYQNWFLRTTQAGLFAGELVVAVPNESTEAWIKQEYSGLIRAAIGDLSLPVKIIRYEISAATAAAMPANGSPHHHNGGHGSQHGGATHGNTAEPLFEKTASWLNPRLTFDTYVVGSSNQLAHAAAHAVATMPSQSYNPLFIYGGVGIGKTHLMHAIGRSLLDNFSGLNVVYTSSERFMNEMITSIKLDRMSLFHRHYRSADVLLIDDIHTIAGKERTQEEFFHTFNELYDHRKQLVISSDSPPNQLPGLVVAG